MRIDSLGRRQCADIRKYAAELVALAPGRHRGGGGRPGGDTGGDSHHADRICDRPDPVGAGFVDSLSRPGGNATGFMMFEYSLCGKWLELLKQIAPSVTRAAVLREPAITAGIGQFAVIQSVAPSVGVDVARSTCATRSRSSAPSRPSRAPQMAA